MENPCIDILTNPSTSALNSILVSVELHVCLEVKVTVAPPKKGKKASGVPPLEDMWDDMVAVIHRQAKAKIDDGNPFLKMEEIELECMHKLGKAFDGGKIAKLDTRGQFFGYFKVMVKNCISSLVQKHVYTAKRTGNDFTKDDKGNITEYRKAAHLSLNDEECGVQVPDYDSERISLDHEYVDDIKNILTPVERLVLDQMLDPNAEALFYAHKDALERQRGKSIRIRVKYEHMAEGIGISVDIFSEAMASMKEKVLKFMATERDGESRQDILTSSAERRLCVRFKLQLPASIPSMVRKRMFTLIARNHHTELTEQDLNDLQQVGAVIPKQLGDDTSCYGVLWQRNHAACGKCSLEESCKATATNVGMGDITPSPRLLGAKLIRIPAIVPQAEAPRVHATEEPHVVPDSERDETVLAYLKDNFKQVMSDGSVCFRHADDSDAMEKRRKPPFSVGKQGHTMRLRFCNPDPELQEELDNRNRGWYLPDDCSVDDALTLIDRHSSMTFANG